MDTKSMKNHQLFFSFTMIKSFDCDIRAISQGFVITNHNSIKTLRTALEILKKKESISNQNQNHIISFVVFTQRPWINQIGNKIQFISKRKKKNNFHRHKHMDDILFHKQALIF